MLNKTPEFDRYYVAYVKDDPAREPIAASYSAPGVLAEAAHKTGRSKADLELQVRVAPTAQSVMCICRSRLEKFAVVSAHHRLRPFFCRAARLAKSGDECVCYLHLRESRQSASALAYTCPQDRRHPSWEVNDCQARVKSASADSILSLAGAGIGVEGTFWLDSWSAHCCSCSCCCLASFSTSARGVGVMSG
jgi:hypothetical protein